MPKLTITYSPLGPAVKDSNLDSHAFAISEAHEDGVSQEVATSTGAFLDAIVRRAILGYIHAGDMELHWVRDCGYVEVMHLDEIFQWVASDGYVFNAEYPQLSSYHELRLRHIFEIEEKRNAKS